ncbi:MAG: glutamate-1-semialdehyde 2,1-aminomutase [Planctomycetota bacterium]|jgi:glutamate-1-semialdehyde 2,1-aminomutase|nr:glutamate-1-semialdehyde 2,1-aminomutase [Planctomycetota bacterium]
MNNHEWFARARAVMPGGVNSPVRAFLAVGGKPLYIARAGGAWIEDVNGNRYVDLVSSWGPLILGHAHPEVVEAVREAAGLGLTYGACHENEVRLAEAIRRAMPHIEKARLVSSGTEAAMSVARLARAATGRDAIVKFRGGYHGHGDCFLIDAGSGALTFGTPSSPGVTRASAAETMVAEYNAPESVRSILAANPGRVAAVFVEPAAGNMGVVPPAAGFLEELRDLTERHGTLLVFDEVITGFRIARGGAVERYGVRPDLAVLGKIVGGGMPLAAFGGRADLMDMLAPEGGVYQAGTLSGNPVSCVAGLKTLEILERDNPYAALERKADRLERAIAEAMRKTGFPSTVNRVGSMYTLFFGIKRAPDFRAASVADAALYADYHAKMLASGVYLPPSQFEACFLSTAFGAAEADRFLDAHEKAVGEL